jgi:hypothetical protein
MVADGEEARSSDTADVATRERHSMSWSCGQFFITAEEVPVPGAYLNAVRETIACTIASLIPSVRDKTSTAFRKKERHYTHELWG